MTEGYLELFLTENKGRRVEIHTKRMGNIGVMAFTGISQGLEQDCGENFDEFGWSFSDVLGLAYSNTFLTFGDIARVRLVGATEWAWEYDRAQAPARELELAV
ncbi:MAG: hypothetical protein FWG65_11890 [Turicibacter sp.]|nr:hypothetical protein [Turicibacter sp.]